MSIPKIAREEILKIKIKIKYKKRRKTIMGQCELGDSR